MTSSNRKQAIKARHEAARVAAVKASQDVTAMGDAVAGQVQTFDLALLLAIAGGRVDVRALAAQELANRGLSQQSGTWVGFELAREACKAAGFGNVAEINDARAIRQGVV